MLCLDYHATGSWQSNAHIFLSPFHLTQSYSTVLNCSSNCWCSGILAAFAGSLSNFLWSRSTHKSYFTQIILVQLKQEAAPVFTLPLYWVWTSDRFDRSTFLLVSLVNAVAALKSAFFAQGWEKNTTKFRKLSPSDKKAGTTHHPGRLQNPSRRSDAYWHSLDVREWTTSPQQKPLFVQCLLKNFLPRTTTYPQPVPQDLVL